MKKKMKNKKTNKRILVEARSRTKIIKDGYVYLSFTGVLSVFDIEQIKTYSIPTLYQSISAFNEIGFDYQINLENDNLDILEKYETHEEERYRIKVIVEKLYQKLYARYGDMILCKYERSNNSSEEALNQLYSIYQALLKLVRIADETIPKYETLLNLYQTKKDNILNELKVITESISKFNDTPQGEGDFSDDEHTSNVNKNNLSQTREESLIARLREIDESFKNCYEDWIMEFEKIFIEEINL